MKTLRNILIIALLITFPNLFLTDAVLTKCYAHAAQVKKTPSKSVFKEIEEGISEGDVDKFSSYLSAQTYLSLSNGASGYYSSNQAFYVLQDYFKINKVSSFRFVSMYEEGDNPYATGTYSHEFRGRRNSAQVFVSLKFQSNGWKITQITFN